MTDHNEKLIEAIAAFDATESVMPDKPQAAYAVVEAARLAVTEKAHTPTDDERETLDQIVREHDGWWPETRDAILAQYVRRSEVPEPSAEEWAARVNAAREKAIAKGYTPEHDAKHGVRHLLKWAIDYARRGRPEDSSGLVAAAIDLADIAYAELERLRHVADTMSAVSEALRTRYASDSQAAYFMRQIDAALEAVTDPQGEPSEAEVQAAAHALSEWLNDNAPIGEARYREPARAALRAAGGVR
ncbi:hypothetical protein SOM10_11965 [Microbacterium sp. CFBP9023]|uniref:hypothetical protein n=1 Tax=Microbacterium sp. CFBP9023 TaxID=3096535 RepID=UPI002A6A8125|nr:hypothetical protein [Microbacterium sp. CFBP9023]MDY0984611.1 hypothetical protein [Microbacterium sp. CFBP9023]